MKILSHLAKRSSTPNLVDRTKYTSNTHDFSGLRVSQAFMILVVFVSLRREELYYANLVEVRNRDAEVPIYWEAHYLL